MSETTEAFPSAPAPEVIAAEGTKPAPKTRALKAPKDADETVTFRSVAREPYEFSVMNVDAELNIDGHLTWTVSAKEAERFERHWFVQNGRIVRT